MKKYIATAFLVVGLFSSVSAQVTDTVTDIIDCANITHVLRLGSKDGTTGGDVTLLQVYLSQAGYLEADPTGYFGNATKRAVQSFQRANGITPQGNVGPITRAKVKEVSCSVSQLTPSMSTIPEEPRPVVTPNECTYSQYWNGSTCVQQGAQGVLSVSTGYIALDSATCTIPAGQSQCGSKISWNVTSPVAGKTEFVVSGSYQYTLRQDSYVSTMFMNRPGENVAKYVLKNNGVTLDTKTVTSKCVSGSLWNGSVCTRSSSSVNNGTNPVATPSQTLTPTSTYVDFQVNNCTIAVGQKTCQASLYVGGVTQYNQGKIYSVSNTTRNITSSNLITPSLYNTSLGKYFLDGSKPSALGDNAAYLVYGNNSLNLLDGTTIVTRGVANASCATGSSWNGGVCAADVGTTPSSTATSTKPSVSFTYPNGGESWVIGNTYTIGYYVQNSVVSPSNPVLVYVQNGSTMWRLCKVDTLSESCSFTAEQSMLNYFGGATSGFTTKVCLGAACDINDVSDKTFSITSSGSSLNTSTYVDFQVNNCTIAVGQKTCQASLYVGGTTQYNQSKVYSVNNATRSITSQNFLTPSLYSSSLGKYFFDGGKPYLLGDNAAVLSYGTNKLSLLDAGTVITQGVATASCATGSTWNGSVCSSTGTVATGAITLDSPTCIIPAGSSQCGAKISWNVSGQVPGKTEFIVAGGFNYTIFQDTYTPTTFMNKGGENVSTYTLKNNGVVLDTKTVTSKCATGSSWNGSVCSSDPVSSTLTSTYVDFQVNNCTIAAGQKTCQASLYIGGITQYNQGKIYSVSNVTRNITSSNLITPTLYNTSLGKYFLDGSKPSALGDNAAYLVYGNNSLNLLDGTTIVTRGVANASCATGSTWNGSVCAGPVSFNAVGDAVVAANTAITTTVQKVVASFSGTARASAMSCVSLNTNLHRGFETGSVTKLQEFLVDKGLLTEKPTGFFGDLTITAVKAYQKSLGLKETGMVYEQTRDAIKGETCQ